MVFKAGVKVLEGLTNDPVPVPSPVGLLVKVRPPLPTMGVGVELLPLKAPGVELAPDELLLNVGV